MKTGTQKKKIRGAKLIIIDDVVSCLADSVVCHAVTLVMLLPW